MPRLARGRYSQLCSRKAAAMRPLATSTVATWYTLQWRWVFFCSKRSNRFVVIACSRCRYFQKKVSEREGFELVLKEVRLPSSIVSSCSLFSGYWMNAVMHLYKISLQRSFVTEAQRKRARREIDEFVFFTCLRSGPDNLEFFFGK